MSSWSVYLPTTDYTVNLGYIQEEDTHAVRCLSVQFAPRLLIHIGCRQQCCLVVVLSQRFSEMKEIRQPCEIRM